MFNTWKTNTITRFLSLFALILLLCLLASVLLFSDLGGRELGTIIPGNNIERIYQSEPFSFHLEDYDVFLPQGGFLAVFPLSNSHSGFVFLAEGEVSQGDDRNTERITGGYLIIDENTYHQIKGDTLFLPLGEHILDSWLLYALQQQIHNPTLNAFGFEKVFLPQEDRSYLYLEYEGIPLVLHHSNSENGFSLSLIFGFYFSLVIVIALLIIQLLSFDLKPSYNLTDYLSAKPSAQEAILSLTILIILFLAHIFGSAASPMINPFSGEAGVSFFTIYLVLFLLVIYLAFKGIIHSPFPHIKWQQLLQDICLGLIITLIIAVLSGLQFSSFAGISFQKGLLAKELLYYFVWAAVFELIWRGVLQTTMERLWGLRWGLLGSVIMLTGVFFVALISHIPERNAFLLWEMLFFVPGTALILGFAYQKRRSILGNAFLLTMLFFLARLLAE